jgi:hypothetical protein
MRQRGTGGTPTMGPRAEHVGPRNTAVEQFVCRGFYFAALCYIRLGQRGITPLQKEETKTKVVFRKKTQNHPVLAQGSKVYDVGVGVLLCICNKGNAGAGVLLCKGSSNS